MENARKMSLSTFIGLLISIIALSTLVVGLPGTIIVMDSAEVTNNPNDYFGPCAIELIKTSKSSKLTAQIPVMKQLPETMQMVLIAQLDGMPPIEYSTSVCDGLSDMVIGKSLVDSGIPKDTFPKRCPVLPGDWVISQWNPPTELIPPGIPDGPVSGSFMFMEEGKEPYIKIDYQGKLSNALPFMGR